MVYPFVLQVGSAVTHGSAQSFVRISLQPWRPSLHFSTATRAKITTHSYALLNNHRQIKYRSLSIRRRAAEVSIEGETTAEVSTEPQTEAEVLIEGNTATEEEDWASIPQGPDNEVPKEGNQFAQFAGGRFWFLLDAFFNVPGVKQINVGYSQGHLHLLRTDIVRRGNTGHAEIVRVEYDPTVISYDQLLDIFWKNHDPTQKNRQGFYLGSQYRSGIYFYSPEQEKAARQSLERQEKRLDKKIVTEILPAKFVYKVTRKILVRRRFEKKLLGGENLFASWLVDAPNLPAAKEDKVPQLPAAKEDKVPQLPAAKEHEDQKLLEVPEHEDPVKV